MNPHFLLCWDISVLVVWRKIEFLWAGHAGAFFAYSTGRCSEQFCNRWRSSCRTRYRVAEPCLMPTIRFRNQGQRMLDERSRLLNPCWWGCAIRGRQRLPNPIDWPSHLNGARLFRRWAFKIIVRTEMGVFDGTWTLAKNKNKINNNNNKI